MLFCCFCFLCTCGTYCTANPTWMREPSFVTLLEISPCFFFLNTFFLILNKDKLRHKGVMLYRWQRPLYKAL